MLRIMDEVTGPNLGVSAIGKVTAEDYESTLIPTVDERLRRFGRIGLLCEIGPRFDGFTVGAAWDDAKFGLLHLSDFSKFALVTDLTWVRNAVRVFAPLIRYPVRIFSNDELQNAIDWLNSDSDLAAAS